MTPLDKRAFFIMAFGRPDLERVWTEAYEPIANSLGFEAVRIDERDNGKVKIDQIINEISTASDIIVGDLTYERPNCYFELGYARAARKEDEILFCARKDHIDHSQYRPKVFSSESSWTLKISLFPMNTPPKVHFDLAAFDILTWDLANLDVFKAKFQKRLQERMRLIRSRTAVPADDHPSPKAAHTNASVDLEKIAVDFRRKAEEQ